MAMYDVCHEHSYMRYIYQYHIQYGHGLEKSGANCKELMSKTILCRFSILPLLGVMFTKQIGTRLQTKDRGTAHWTCWLLFICQASSLKLWLWDMNDQELLKSMQISKAVEVDTSKSGFQSSLSAVRSHLLESKKTISFAKIDARSNKSFWNPPSLWHLFSHLLL